MRRIPMKLAHALLLFMLIIEPLNFTFAEEYDYEDYEDYDDYEDYEYYEDNYKDDDLEDEEKVIDDFAAKAYLEKFGHLEKSDGPLGFIDQEQQRKAVKE